MAVVPMKKMSLLGLADDKNRILSRLMEIGLVEINDLAIEESYDYLFDKDVNDTEINDIVGKITSCERAIKIIAPYDNRKKPLFSVRTELSIHDYRQVIFKRHDVLAKCRKIMSLQDEIISKKNAINRNHNNIDNLKPWALLKIPIDTNTTAKTNIYHGTFPAIADLSELVNDINEQELLCELYTINTDSDQYYVTAIMYREDEKNILQFLKRNGFSVINFSKYNDMIEDNINNLHKDNKELQTVIDDEENILKQFATSLYNIEVVFDYYSIRRQMELADEEIIKSKRVFMLEGWIPLDKAEILSKELHEKWTVDISLRDPLDEEQFPVLLSNGFIGDSTEGITAMYATPKCREVDPNTVMAPFFIMFFGLMLSDAGYGLVMAIACGILYYRIPLEETTKKFIKLMMLSGVATIFWGALFGSWFGNFIPLIFLGDGTIDISIWFDPVKDPEYLLMWSLLFGVIHVFVGLGMRGANLVKQKKYLAILFDVVTWYVFFLGATFIVMPMVPGVPADVATIFSPYGGTLLIIGAAALLLTQGRSKKGVVGKIVGGLSSLYDLVTFMSDVLSYSRLLAMGLATSVIATIINDMGSMGGWTIIGTIAFILIFAFGHSFNFALNALGAYVHSSRLQYIEFFNKFYEGGGKPFAPFKRQTKYVKIKN
ncbi:MAG: V-type ATP synthase subunit I [Clostridiales bacterium]|nr:V-type ATP synthase subunit I [Clostridiales bacterium]